MTASRPKICTLCGSTKFKSEFEKANKRLTAQGIIVLSVGWFGHSDPIPDDIKAVVDQLHFRKIDMSDYILVLNVGGYIGESTRNEIEYAKSVGCRIEYLEPIKNNMSDRWEDSYEGMGFYGYEYDPTTDSNCGTATMTKVQHQSSAN
ncbi:MAG: hypothetical protein KME52_09925 [Desmonostoc geniculatum HA4340-LM1]|jgi:hypothetical protein|nr:hypothetical protein [Desmonostoc geniculatum HA4340-LM1]